MKNTWSFLIIPKIFMLLAVGLLPFGTQTITAQNSAVSTVTGTVVDVNNEPLIGVAIYVVGTSKGTITDLDGNYTIEINNSKSVLRFSYTGFTSKEVTVGTNRKIDVTLLEDLQQLDEVVVVGYGIQKKSHLTGSITKVKTDGLDDIPSSRLDQALQGRIAGVQIQNTTSEVGETPSIRVRGMGSISAGGAPLVIVDGFPVAGGLEVVNSNDVESIEVLKDAASAAIYGSRAANGVIMVTTKQGTIDKPKYTLRTSWGTKAAYKLHPIMTNKEYVEMRAQEEIIKGSAKFPDAEFAFKSMDNETNWQEVGTRSANIYNLQLGISGGTKNLKYYISGSHMNDQGIMLKNEYEKTNLRVKLDANLSKKVTVGVNLAPTYTSRLRPTVNFIDFYRIPAWMPVTHTEATSAITGFPVGSYTAGSQFNNGMYTTIDPITGLEETRKASPFTSANHNPKAILDNEESTQKDYRLQTSAYLNVNIMKGLDFKTSNGVDVLYSDIDIYRNKASRTDGAKNRGLYQNKLTIDLISENTITYSTKINKSHDINALLGASAQKTTFRRAGILGTDFPTDNIRTLNAAGTINQFEVNSDGSKTLYTGTWQEESTMVSYFSRLTYAYEDRYLLSASLRTDGSSRFGVDKRWGWFPSVSLGWRVSEESFIKNSASFSWMDQFKIRTSYGVTGTNEIKNYANTDKLQSANYIWGTGNGSVGPGLANNSSTLGNPLLMWEQTNEYNGGFDLSMLKNRLGLNVDLYYSTTKKLLFEKNVNSVSGYTKGWSNEGKVRNQGIEIELTTFNVQGKDFNWNTSINFARNENKLLDLGGSAQLINLGEAKEKYLSRVGGPAIQFYGFKTIGVWKNQEEIDNNPHHIKDVPGGLRVWDANKDGEITDADMIPLGNPFPDFTWGITNNLKYKDIDLSFLIQGVQGVDVWNGDGRYNETRKWNKNYVANRWIDANNPGDGKTPYFTNGIDHYSTDYYIQDGSYIALKDITLGYTFPKSMMKKTMFSRLRVYASVQNWGFWFTGDYKGINPEARLTSGDYDSPLVAGFQRGAFPIQRTFNFGIDINF